MATKKEKTTGVIIQKKSRVDKHRLRIINLVLLKYFNTFILIFLLILIYSGYIYFLRPKYNSIKEDINNTYNDKTQEFDDLNAYLVRLNTYYRSYTEVNKEDVNRIQDILPFAGDFENYFITMEQFAEDKGVEINSISISPDTTKKQNLPEKTAAKKKPDVLDGVGEVKVEITFLGVDYERFKNILNTFENSLRLTDITDISFSPNNGQLGLKFKSYYFEESPSTK